MTTCSNCGHSDDYVYIIYDVCITSIRGVFPEQKNAKNAIDKLKDIDGCVIMKVPLNTIFDGINETKLDKNPNYLTTKI